MSSGAGEGKEPEVLFEVPVYLCKSLWEKLCLVQFPQQPASLSAQQLRTSKVEIKPNQRKLAITHTLDKASDFFDPESAEMLAEAAAGIGLDEDQYMPDHRLKLEKLRLESAPALNPQNHVIAHMTPTAVTLAPFSSIYQMKPTFPHLNKAEKAKERYEKERTGEADSGGEEPEATKVTVKFSRNLSKAQQAQAQKEVENEPWKELQLRPKGTKEARAEIEKLLEFSEESGESNNFYVLPEGSYLSALFPKPKDVLM